MARIYCEDCGDESTPNNPSMFLNIRPKEQRLEFGGFWVCEDCHGQRRHLAEAFGLTQPPR